MTEEPKKIYVVMKTEGEYSDREVECFKGFWTEEDAQNYIDRITQELQKVFPIPENSKRSDIVFSAEDFPLLKEAFDRYESGEISNPRHWGWERSKYDPEDYGVVRFHIDKVKMS